MSIFEYDEEKELALFRAAEREQGLSDGREQGLAEGREQGLRALIHTLKNIYTDTNQIYIEVIKNPIYADLTKEAFEKYL